MAAACASVGQPAQTGQCGTAGDATTAGGGGGVGWGICEAKAAGGRTTACGEDMPCALAAAVIAAKNSSIEEAAIRAEGSKVA